MIEIRNEGQIFNYCEWDSSISLLLFMNLFKNITHAWKNNLKYDICFGSSVAFSLEISSRFFPRFLETLETAIGAFILLPDFYVMRINKISILVFRKWRKLFKARFNVCLLSKKMSPTINANCNFYISNSFR